MRHSVVLALCAGSLLLYRAAAAAATAATTGNATAVGSDSATLNGVADRRASQPTGSSVR